MNYKKRKYEEVNSDSDDDEKPKFFKNPYEEKIYTIGSELHFTAHIDDDTIELAIKKISSIINKNKSKLVEFSDNSQDDLDFDYETDKFTITYIVDSPGGSVTSILKFVDFIRMIKSKYKNIEFVSIVTGLVASAGTIMCIIADKRKMTKYAHAMIHELSGGTGGGVKYTHIKSHAKFVTDLHNALVDIYMTSLKKEDSYKKNLEKMLTDESWFNSQEYLKNGFVHEIK